MLSGAKASPRPTGLSLHENLENHQYEGKQMTAGLVLAGAPSSCDLKWDDINWHPVEKYVRRLQMRIAKAIREGRHGKAKSLQWLLTHSFAAKLLAVKRVTQNRGSKTAGVDDVTWKSAKQKMQAAKSLQRKAYKAKPLRRIYIPKANGKRRPLGIPTMKDRAMQALHLLALEPISETLADRHSYGFRAKRSTADAIEQCFIVLARKTSAQWILEGDIKGCFDNIKHEWMLNNIPTDKTILRQWLKAGYIEKQCLHSTEEGTPQGGIISPTAANMVLDGLLKVVADATKLGDKVNVVRYADDFIITGNSKELLEDKVKPAIIAFLSERGLELSQEKTKITHIEDGFDFLGFNVRKYNGKLLIKPAKKSIKALLDGFRDTIKTSKALSTTDLIRILNPKIRGWTNYYRHVIAKKTFSYIHYCIFKAIWQWAKRRHPNKNSTWRQKKYFCCRGTRQWIFFAKTRNKNDETIFLELFNANSVAIKRHVKIRADANPFDPQFKEYFEKRKSKKVKAQPWMNRKWLVSGLPIYRGVYR